MFVRAVEDVLPSARQQIEAPVRDRMIREVSEQPGVIAGFEFLGARLTERVDHLQTTGPVSSGFPGPLDPAVALDTDWRPTATSDAVYWMRLDIVDAAGRVVSTHTRVLGYIVWPVADWPRGSVTRERYDLEPGIALAPGKYSVRMGIARAGASIPVQVETHAAMPFVLGSFTVGATRP